MCAFVKVGGMDVREGREVFRVERVELYGEKESYSRFSEQTLKELG